MKRINFFVTSFASFILLLYSGLNQASTVSGLVNGYYTDSQYFYFTISGSISSKPTCNTRSEYAVLYNTSNSTSMGNTIMNQIVNAKNNNLSVSVFGNGTCNLVGVSEDVHYVGFSGTPVPPSTPVAPSNGYWATVGGVANCNDTCNNDGAIAEADSSGNVCKALMPGFATLQPGTQAYSNSNYQTFCTGGSLGNISASLAQCYCVKK